MYVTNKPFGVVWHYDECRYADCRGPSSLSLLIAVIKVSGSSFYWWIFLLGPFETFKTESTIDIILKIDCLMARTTCIVCLVSTVSGCSKNTLGRASASSGHITKLEQSTFLRYLWKQYMNAYFVHRFIHSFYRCLCLVSTISQPATWRHNNQKNDTQHNDTQHEDTQYNIKWNATLSIMALNTECCYAGWNYAECRKQAHNAECRYAECRYAKCRYTECRGACHLINLKPI
jgi:hypothetical protein